MTDGAPDFTGETYTTRSDGTPRPASDYEKGTCVCGRVRKLARQGKWGHRCRACYDLTGAELDTVRKEAERLRNDRAAKARLAYPCIGGPLDGEHATTDDFAPGYGEPGHKWYRQAGMYGHLSREYVEFNRAGGGGRKKIGAPATMIFVHDPRGELRIKAPRDR
jgi:hypothetical protein